MFLNVAQCDGAIADGIKELGNFFDVHISSSGLKLTVRKGEKFIVSRRKNAAEIQYVSKHEIFKGIGELLASDGDFEREYVCAFDTLALMEDCARNAVMTVASVKRLIAVLALLGYNQLELYLEDVYALDGEPRFGLFRGRYSAAELKEIDDYGKKFGVEVMGCIQTLAHLNQAFRWKEYAEICDCEDILLAEDELTYRLLDKMFDRISSCLSSRYINIGFDEAHLVGAGKYMDRHGYVPRFEILCRHLRRVCAIAERYGLKPVMWSDMFFKLLGGGYYNDEEIPESLINEVPEDVALCYWNYYCRDGAAYDRMIKRHKRFRNEIWFAGGTTAWMNFTPMNVFSEKIVDESVHSCVAGGIRRYVFTDWGDDGGECPVFSSLPLLWRLAQRAYGGFCEEGFSKLFGIGYGDFCTLDAPNIFFDGQDELVNPAKYVLYNDCLCGVYDKNIAFNEKFYRKRAEMLPQPSGCFGILFRTAKSLMNVLLLKATIGGETRAYYRAGDKEGLKRLLEGKYEQLLLAAEKFYRDFREEWFSFNKPFGWEVQDIRLGGLIARIQTCMERIGSYIRSETEVLEELEEEPKAEFETKDGQLLRIPKWRECVSVNNI